MVNPLHGLAQAIHQDHLDPPGKFFLHSTVVKDDDSEGQVWEVRLYANVNGKMEVWLSKLDISVVPAKESILQEAIEGGMLHVSLKGKKRLQKGSKLELQFLRQGEENISLDLGPSDSSESDGVVLLEAAFSLLARKPAPGGYPDKAEMRNLRTQITKKDDEISKLQTQLANMRATAHSTRSEELKKKLMASPKKPAGASTLQPNAKRRKAVADEFAGSDDD